MRYYIIKPKNQEPDKMVIAGIKEVNPNAVFVQNLHEADTCVLQKGWTRSKLCVKDYRLAKEKKISTKEANIFTDRCAVKTN